MTRHLMWFRADLRTIDNTALAMACQHPDTPVIALYFISTAQWQAHDVAGCKIDFELRTLQQLSDELARLNISLQILYSADFKQQLIDLKNFCQAQNITAVFYNKQYEINELQRDQQLQPLLAGMTVHAFDDQCLVAPQHIKTGEGRFYSVYTPFKKAWLQHINQQGVSILGKPTPRTSLVLAPSPVPTQVLGFASHLTDDIAQKYWPAGEQAALARLDIFCQQHIRGYKDNRDFPFHAEGTSRLSPYLAIGAISSRQCYQAAINEQQAYGASNGIDHWISELGWREFYKHIMVGFERVCKHQPFKLETNAIVWQHDEENFARWCAGKTGFPLVDAAMRQLHTIGWMHNRLRMVTAMFLTKDLGIDWRWGERYFMQHLIDGDLAANNGGWQWCASTGNDAAPYFRIFNPTLQSLKFDANGDFIRHYLPELAHLDNKTIHEPHGKQRQLFLDYPMPIVDHKAAAKRSIEVFESIKASASQT